MQRELPAAAGERGAVGRLRRRPLRESVQTGVCGRGDHARVCPHRRGAPWRKGDDCRVRVQLRWCWLYVTDRARLRELCGAAAIELPPIAAGVAGEHHPGKVVWADLVTPDLAGAEHFYGGVVRLDVPR